MHTVSPRSSFPFRLALAGACLAVTVLAAAAPGQTLHEEVWSTDNDVHALVASGDTLYLGGNFSYVGPHTGAGVPVDPVTGDVVPGFPIVEGGSGIHIWAVAPDGSGGWFIGGTFTSVGGQARTNLAHINADLSVSSWNPGATGLVLALAVDGSTLYVGGSFGTIGGVSRFRLAALDVATGVPTSWDPNPSGGVRSLAVTDSVVYVGGDFTTIGGATRNRLAAIDKTTGLANGWDPSPSGPSPFVFAFAVTDTAIYAGGSFVSIGGAPRYGLAGIDPVTGLAIPWNPTPASASNQIRALSLVGSTLYVGGSFNNMGGATRHDLAAFDLSTGLVTSWDPDLASGSVSAMAPNGSVIHVGGVFPVTIGGVVRKNLAAVDATTGAVTAWNPSASSQVDALAMSGSTLYVGSTNASAGYYCSIGGAPRKNLAAIDATTGQVLPWDPSANSTVNALVLNGSRMYVGGLFTTIGGVSRANLVAVDAVSGALDPWNPNINPGGLVNALALDGSTLYAGGAFTSAGGSPRLRLAGLDVVTGLATPFDPGANNAVHSVAVDGSTVYAGGLFTSIGGATRNRVAALDAATGLATAWDPNANSIIRTFEIDGSTVYVGGGFSTIGGATRRNLAALDAVTGLATAWDPDPNSQVYDLLRSGDVLYVGGNFTTIGGSSPDYLAALDFVTGSALSWNPPGLGLTLRSIAVVDTTVFGGGTFVLVNGEPRPGLVALTGVVPDPLASTCPFPPSLPDCPDSVVVLVTVRDGGSTPLSSVLVTASLVGGTLDANQLRAVTAVTDSIGDAVLVFPCGIGGSGNVDIEIDAGGVALCSATYPLTSSCEATPYPWILATVDSLDDVGAMLDMDLDGSGLAHISYYSYYDATNAELKYARELPSGGWGVETVDVDAEVNDEGNHTSIEVDSVGTPHISHYDQTNAIIKYATKSGGVWVEEVVEDMGLLGGDGADGHAAALALYLGQPRIAYYHVIKRGISLASKDLGSWSFASLDTGLTVRDIDLAIGSSGEVHIAYTTQGDGKLRYAVRDGGLWTVTDVVSPVQSTGTAVSIALDASEDPHIAFRGVGGHLTVGSRSGGVWTFESTACGDLAYPSLVWPAVGMPQVAFYDRDEGGLHLATKTPTGWERQDVDAMGSFNLAGTFTALRLTPWGGSRIAYYDATAGDLRFALARFEHVFHVPSPELPTIQAGLNVAAAGDTVLLAAGTYQGDGNRDLDFHGKDIVLMSESGADSTIIDCQGSSGDPHRGFWLHNGETVAAVVSGVTVQNGYATGNGGGALLESASPTIQDCVFSSNVATSGGGGLYASADSLAIFRTVFNGNQAVANGGGFRWNGPAIYLADCVFSDNTLTGSFDGYGGGAYLASLAQPGTMTLERCDFMANRIEIPHTLAQYTQGGGLSVVSVATTKLMIADCRVQGNAIVLPDSSFGTQASHGAGMYLEMFQPSSSIELWNTIITQNSVEDPWDLSSAIHQGAGVYVSSSNSSLTGCTIADNSISDGDIVPVAIGEGGGVYSPSAVNIDRTIVWGNCALSGDEVYSAGTTSITCSAVDSTAVVGATYTGDNIFVDPLFCNPAGCDSLASGDYSLAANSRCLSQYNSCGQLIGALGEGCPSIGPDPITSICTFPASELPDCPDSVGVTVTVLDGASAPLGGVLVTASLVVESGALDASQLLAVTATTDGAGDAVLAFPCGIGGSGTVHIEIDAGGVALRNSASYAVLSSCETADPYPWILATVDSPNDVGAMLDMDLDAGGLAHVSYYDATNADLKYAWESGSGWNVETVDAEMGQDEGNLTSIAVDSAGTPHISHYNQTASTIMYATKSGGVWAEEVVEDMGAPGANEYAVALALDPGDVPWIAYYHVVNQEISLATKNGSWSFVALNVGLTVWDIDMVIGSNGDVHIAYTTSGFKLRYAVWDGATWTVTDSVSAVSGLGRAVSIALDASEDPHIAFRGVGGHLTVGSRSGGVWTFEQAACGDLAYPSLLWPSGGTPQVTFSDRNDGGLYLATRTPTGWERQRVDTMGSFNYVGTYTTLRLTPWDEPRIAYYDATAGDLRFADTPTSLLWVDATSGPLSGSGGTGGSGVAWGDYDNDGNLDLYLTQSGPNKLLQNQGDGTFVDTTSTPLNDAGFGTAGAWGDYNNDGDLDLYIANTVGQANKLFRNDGGAFLDATNGPLGDTRNGYSVSWADYDNDGHLDVYVVNNGSVNTLFRNEGDGTFTDATSGPVGGIGVGGSAAWGDYDNDGDLDLYLSNISQANQLVRNDGGSGFVLVTSGPLIETGSGYGVAWGDYDNDGDLDLYLANQGQANKLFRNEGSDTFVDATSGPLGDTGFGRSVAWGDYDNDGDLDLYLVNATSANKLFRNEGSDTFVDAISGPLGDTGVGSGAAWGDYDRDGDLDLYLVNGTAQANKLFRNQAAADQNWLQVKLEGTLSNRAGIGARVRVVADGVSRIREISGGSGYLSQDAMVAAFGLGSATMVDSLIVNWPSGIAEVFTNVPIGQAMVITEGTYSAPTPPGSNVSVSLGQEVDLMFDTVTEGGDSQMMLVDTGPPSPRGLSTPSIYRDLSTTATFSGKVSLCVAYDPADVVGDENQLLLMHYDPPVGWREITSSRDPVNNKICGTASHFSLFAVMEPLSVTGLAAGLHPEAFRLYQNFPNPMMQSTNIRFDLAESSPVRLLIFDVNGRLVRALVEETTLPAGRYSFPWDGQTSRGQRAAAGVYFYRLDTGAIRQQKRLVVLR